MVTYAPVLDVGMGDGWGSEVSVSEPQPECVHQALESCKQYDIQIR